MKKILNIIRKDNVQYILFFFLLFIIYFFYNYQEIIFLKPQGIHFIRQTDSLSFVKGYYNYGMNFFEPRILNLESTEGKAASEFPILYYITACLYFVFGEKECILRLLNIGIVSVGFFFLFKLIRDLLENIFYAFVFSFLFLSSTILVYYTNNFLPDCSAFGLVLIAWYYFYKYFSTGNNKKLFLSFLFFTISSLLKITFFINPIAGFITILFCYFYKKIPRISFPLFLFSISLGLNVLWIIFVIHYNKINGSNYFSTNIRPIWNMSNKSIQDVLDHVLNYWYTKYYFQSTFHLMLVIVFIGTFYVKRIKKEILIATILLIFGSISYILLFFQMFKDHDYYFITILSTIIFTTLAAFQGIQKKFPRVVNHLITKLIILTICILSINYSEYKLSKRYTENIDEASKIGQKFIGFDDYLTRLKVKNSAKLIVVKDLSKNGSLYFLDRQGWTSNDFSNLDKSTLTKYIYLGAEYLIITDEKQIQPSFDFVKRIGKYNGLTIFKFKKTG